MNFNFCKIIFVFTCLFAGPAFGKVESQSNKRSDKTRITSDVIDIKRNLQTIDFIGNVVVKNGPDSMTSQKMTVLYEDNSKKSLKSQEKIASKTSSIKRIDAEKDVKVFGADFVASSDKGHYIPNKNLFVLEQNVIVNNGDSIGTGEKFIYSLETRKGKFIGKSGQVKPNEDRRVIVVIGNDRKKKSSKKEKK